MGSSSLYKVFSNPPGSYFALIFLSSRNPHAKSPSVVYTCIARGHTFASIMLLNDEGQITVPHEWLDHIIRPR